MVQLHYLPHTVLRLHRVDSRDGAHPGVLQPPDSASSPSRSNSSEYTARYYPTIGDSKVNSSCNKIGKQSGTIEIQKKDLLIVLHGQNSRRELW